ncbi:Phage terminase, large subunit GpA [Loktanella atrilutea]|uniref:Phage terminase, large subunit GpA n=2 Tax=Loktanella atrilutea TaxID=366533 RepID=A0A1M4WCX8_LOKAT|nr:Phage terminase, large subunit GpA [Loktanella atrilutea]
MIPFSSALHDGGMYRNRRYRRAAAVTAAQSGKSDNMLDVIGARLDQRPAPILYVGPTADFIRDQFEPRLMSLLDEAQTLAAKVIRGRRMKKTLKHVAGVPVRLAHGGSSSALKSDPAALALIDEYDEMLSNVKGQGDVLGLVEARGETYADFVTGVVSTCSRGLIVTDLDDDSGLRFWSKAEPDDIESAIWSLWQEGTRHHFAWPCRQCETYFVPRLDCLKWPKGATPARARAEAWVECPHCGGVLIEDDKAWMNARGDMVAPGETIRFVNDGPEIAGAPVETSTLSFWTSGLCSPFVTIGQRAETYLTALASGDHSRIQTALNASFGECYAIAGAGDVPEWEDVKATRILPYKRGVVPEQTLRVVAGVDVQGTSLYFAIRAFGARGTSWLIDYGQLFGPTDDDQVWNDLTDVLMTPIDGWQIERCLIDSGFRPNKKNPGSEHRVYSYVHQMSWLCHATKGKDVAAQPYRTAKIEVKKDGSRSKKSIEMVHLSSDFFKSLVMARLRMPLDQPGAFYLPEDISEDYCRQLVSEERIVVDGKPTWIKRQRDNHYLDCEALCAAAAYSLNVHRIPDASEAKADPKGPTVPPRRPTKGAPVEVRIPAKAAASGVSIASNESTSHLRGLGARLNGRSR